MCLAGRVVQGHPLRARPWQVGMPCPPWEGFGARAHLWPPPHGTFEVFHDDGANVGTVTAFHCHSSPAGGVQPPHLRLEGEC